MIPRVLEAGEKCQRVGRSNCMVPSVAASRREVPESWQEELYDFKGCSKQRSAREVVENWQEE